MVENSNPLSHSSEQNAVRLAFKITSFGVAFTFFVVLVGVFTRLMDAGLGCPDWPGCYGAIVVPSSDHAMLFDPNSPLEPLKAWIEMKHRYIASALGLVALFLAGFAIKHRRIALYPVKTSCLLLAVICLQGAFGAWTVTLNLWPQVVTLHLLGGFSVLALFFILRFQLKACLQGKAFSLKPPPLWWAVMLMLVLQVALGGWTSSNYAGIACTGFPTCNGEWWPDYIDFTEGFHITQEVGPNYLYGQLHAGGRAAIHYTHRMGALVLGILLFVFFFKYHRHRTANNALKSAVATYCIQIVLGIILVLFSMPLSIALLHTAGAAFLMLFLLTAGMRLGQGEVHTYEHSGLEVQHA